MRAVRATIAATVIAVVTTVALRETWRAGAGCAVAEGCTAGDDGMCVPPSPCGALGWTCGDAHLELRRLGGAADRSPGVDALAARGDVLLGNSRVRVVLDDIGSPHYLAPSGGGVVDMAPRPEDAPGSEDDLNQVLQAVGILPDDAVH